MAMSWDLRSHCLIFCTFVRRIIRPGITCCSFWGTVWWLGITCFFLTLMPTKRRFLWRSWQRCSTSSKKTQGTGEFELISFHSCSMSSLELAYELQGTANYMLASQGPNFVGSYPTARFLIKAFNDTNCEGQLPSPRATILKFFSYILCNSFDFQLAGYSFDLCLCDLREARKTKELLAELSGLLIDVCKLTILC